MKIPPKDNSSWVVQYISGAKLIEEHHLPNKELALATKRKFQLSGNYKNGILLAKRIIPMIAIII